MKDLKEEMEVPEYAQQDPLDDSEDFENMLNPFDLLEVSPVDVACAPHLGGDVDIFVQEKAPFRCEDCYVAFPDYSSFRYHVIVRHGKDPVVLCDTCGQPCSSRESQHRHKMESHMPKSEVNQIMNSPKFIIISQGPVLSLKKKKPQKKMQKSKVRKKPIKTISKKVLRDCKKKLKRLDSVMKCNKVSDHNKSDEEYSPEEPGRRKNVTSDAPKTYNLRPSRKGKPKEEPMEDIEPVKPKNLKLETGSVKCQECKSRFHSDEGLENHRIAKHGYKPPDIKAKCAICGKEFKSFSVYKRHGPEKCTRKPEERKIKWNLRKRKS